MKSSKIKLILDCVRQEISNRSVQSVQGRKAMAGLRSKIYLLVYAFLALKFIFRDIINIIFRGGVILSTVEIVVTTKCSLRCKECSNLMQYYNSPYDVDLDILLKSLERIAACYKKILRISIIGGEPFVSAHFLEVLKLLNMNPKFESIYICTNGTVDMNRMPNELIKELQSDKVCLHISAYPFNKNIDSNLNFFNDRGIKYIFLKNLEWTSWGGIECRKKSVEEMKKQFKQCVHKQCHSILNGKMYYCLRQGHCIDLGVFAPKVNDGVDLLEETDNEIIRQRIYDMIYKSEYIRACNYCDQGTDCSIIIPVAEQMDRVQNALK